MHFVRDEEPDLSARQMAILLTVYLEAPPHTVRGLAGKLAVSKPVITRALDSMGKHNLVTRRRDDTTGATCWCSAPSRARFFWSGWVTRCATSPSRSGPEPWRSIRACMPTGPTSPTPGLPTRSRRALRGRAAA
jgi:hypothetical protein